jgi:DNA-binding CsgD family transcriptional regulator
MRSSPTPLTFDSPASADDPPLREAVRLLVEMAESASDENEILPNEKDQDHSEVILVDVEVDGARYLLVRMPRLSRIQVQLSPREQEIGRMVAKGHPNKVIADVLNISSWTVCTHMRRMFAKLGVGTRAAMVARLLEIGVIASDHRVPADARSFEVINRSSRL